MTTEFIIEDLTIERGEAVLFAGVSVSLSAGQTLWVQGANGVGKSSLLSACAGLLRPTSGRCYWAGPEPIQGNPNRIGVLLHRDAHKRQLTCLEQLEFWSDLSGADIPPEDALGRVGLARHSNQKTGTLSAGQSRKLAFARLIQSGASLWIMDEPTAALDAKSEAVFYSILKEHLENSGMAIIASHAPRPNVITQAKLLQFGEAQ